MAECEQSSVSCPKPHSTPTSSPHPPPIQAKTEANELVEGYRAEKEAAFNSKSADLLVMDDGTGIEAETAQEIGQMKADYAKNRDATIEMMMGLVTNVTLK